MFRQLRSRIHHYLLKKKLKEAPAHEHQTVNYERAKSIAVLFDATNPENLTIAKKFNQDLASLHKHTHFFAFVDQKKPMGSLPFDFMTSEQVSWLFVPEHPKVQDFLTKQYDILINICAHECLPLEYIAALSNAKFRVGRFIPGKTYCYDFMIYTNGKKDMNFLIEQLNQYLKMMK